MMMFLEWNYISKRSLNIELVDQALNKIPQ